MDILKPGVAVVIDLVDSRKHPDRSALQRTVVDALSAVNVAVPAIQPLVPSIGDESQAVYLTVPQALAATLLVRLHLLHDVDCRFGIGIGRLQIVDQTERGLIQDGSAWWTARDAIVEGKRREKDRDSTLRTWFAAAADAQSTPPAQIVNAYLLGRDHLVTTMSDRSRRLLLGLLEGVKQVDLAMREGISESAVSQSLRRSGAHAILSGMQLLTGKAAS